MDIFAFNLLLSDSVDATHATPKFVKDTSKFWYKPNISREEGRSLIMVVIENVMNMCTQLILFQRVDQIIQKYLFVQKFLKFIFISQVQII